MRYFFYLFFLPLATAFAQTQQLPCNCGALGNDTSKKFIVDEKAAQKILNDYTSKLSNLTKIAIKQNVVIKAAACPYPQIELCPTQLPDGRPSEVGLILYNNKFLEAINAYKDQKNTWVDRHILLHEFGHHALGHLKDGKSIEALNKLFQQSLDEKQRRALARYGSSNPLAQELEADIFAVWVLSKVHPDFDIAQLIGQFDTEELKKRDISLSQASHSEHPLFKDRLQTMQNAYKSIKTNPINYPSRKYFADMASTAYLEIWPDRPVHELSLIAGTILGGMPRFSVQGEAVEAVVAPPLNEWNFQVGVSLSRFRWNRPVFFALDAYWARQQYKTLIDANTQKNVIEDLKFGYAVVGPQVGINTAGLKQEWSLRSLRIGLIASAGLNVFIPAGNPSYTNYLTPTPTPDLLPSVAPRASVGVSVARKSFLARNIKWLISYEPQNLRLTTTNARAHSHNLTTTLQYALWRR
ncbi:MAG: hypothetical protein ACK4GN_04095 [Runella sp.]